MRSFVVLLSAWVILSSSFVIAQCTDLGCEVIKTYAYIDNAGNIVNVGSPSCFTFSPMSGVGRPHVSPYSDVFTDNMDPTKETFTNGTTTFYFGCQCAVMCAIPNELNEATISVDEEMCEAPTPRNRMRCVQFED